MEQDCTDLIFGSFSSAFYYHLAPFLSPGSQLLVNGPPVFNAVQDHGLTNNSFFRRLRGLVLPERWAFLALRILSRNSGSFDSKKSSISFSSSSKALAALEIFSIRETGTSTVFAWCSPYEIQQHHINFIKAEGAK